MPTKKLRGYCPPPTKTPEPKAGIPKTQKSGRENTGTKVQYRSAGK